MKKGFQYGAGFLFCLFYFFSSDLMAMLSIEPFIPRGHVCLLLRLPLMGCSVIGMIILLADIFKINNRLHYMISTIIGFSILGIIFFSSLSISDHANVFQLYWYPAATLGLIISSIVMLLGSIGIIKEPTH